MDNMATANTFSVLVENVHPGVEFYEKNILASEKDVLVFSDLGITSAELDDDYVSTYGNSRSNTMVY
jgi:hypothetical protein